MFANAASVAISGGQFNNSERDQVIFNVSIAHLEVTNASQPGGEIYPAPYTLSSSCLAQISRQARTQALSTNSASPSISTHRRLRFDVVKELLQVTDHLDVYPAKFSSLIRRDVSELGDAVAFCERAHRASKSTALFTLFNRQMVTRMEYCAETLKRVHSLISKLPYSSIPSWIETGLIVLGWFLDRDQIPDDIVAIRLELIKEIELLGADLGSLKRCVFSIALCDPFTQNIFAGLPGQRNYGPLQLRTSCSPFKS